MTPREMIKTPVNKRRGAVTNQSAHYQHLIVKKDPDTILDALLAGKVIGAAKRDCLKASRANGIPRPIGSWGMLIRLKGHPYTYVLGDKLEPNWASEWAEKLDWECCYFMSSQTGVHRARSYAGKNVLFDFARGYMEARPSNAVYREDLDDSEAMIYGTSEVCNQKWLDSQQTGGDALDALAQFADVYIPVTLHHGVTAGNVKPHGWDGDAYPEGDDELYQQLPDTAFERIDVFTFGGPETLEPSSANLMLAAAVHRCDAAGAQLALQAGADPNLMSDSDESPLIVALGHGSPYLKGGRFASVSPEQLLDLMKVLLKAGAKPDSEGASAIHTALHWGQNGDQRSIVDQLRLLLDFNADPNSSRTMLFETGNRPLHQVVQFSPWLGVLKLLVSRGADPKAGNSAGKTPRELAEASLSKLESSQTKSLGNMFGKAIPGMASALAKLQSAVATENVQKIARLKAAIAFLDSAESGTADVSDIDQIVDESSTQYAIDKKLKEAEKQEHLKSLLETQKKLLQQMGAGASVASAEKVIEDNKKLFIERYEYRQATEADFAARDRAWYDSMKDTLNEMGFHCLGDYVNESIAKAAGVIAVLRRFVSADNATMAVVYQVVRENKVAKTTTDMKVYECESELSDGSFITTSNTGGSNVMTSPKQISAARLPAETSLAELVKQHETSKSIALKRDPALKLVRIQSIEDYTAAQDRQSAIKAAFRQGIGFLDPAEIRRIAEQKFPNDPIKVALTTVGASAAQKLELLKGKNS